jgi:hypothetical protein
VEPVASSLLRGVLLVAMAQENTLLYNAAVTHEKYGDNVFEVRRVPIPSALHIMMSSLLS